MSPQLKFTASGSHLVTLGASDRRLYFLASREASLRLLGHTAAPVNISCMDIVDIGGEEQLFVGTEVGDLYVYALPPLDHDVTEGFLLRPAVIQVRGWC